MNLTQVTERLAESGLLMLSDKELPSLVRLAAGQEVKGSWWGHEKGHEIFRLLEAFESQPDCLKTRLVSGKITYVHRRLWPELLSVATSRSKWQVNGLAARSRSLLSKVDGLGELRTDDYPGSGDAARELERRLLVYGDEIHTDSGAHAKVLMTWSRCPKIRDLRIPARTLSVAQGSLERIVDRLNEKFSGHGKLPWRQNN